MSWGEDLRTRREELGYSLQEVEDETKIRRLYLEALENENFSILPPKIYAVGFVKNYARFLHMNTLEVTEQFKEIAYSNEISEEEPYAYASNEGKPLLPQWLTATNVFAALVFLFLAIWIGNYLVGYFAGQNIVEEPTKPPIIQPSEPDPTPGIQVPNDTEDDDTITVPEKVSLSVTASQNCWLRVIIDGEHNFTGTILAGEEKAFVGQQSVNIRAGNAGGIDIVFNGQEIGNFGDIGQVKEQEFTI